MRNLQAAIKRDCLLLDLEAHTSHHFCPGLYCREFRIPAGYTAVGQMHASHNFFAIPSGRVAVSTRDGMRIIDGPFLSVTQPGDKRVAHAITDTIMWNFHVRADEIEDMQILETRYVIPEEFEGNALEYLQHKRIT